MTKDIIDEREAMKIAQEELRLLDICNLFSDEKEHWVYVHADVLRALLHRAEDA